MEPDLYISKIEFSNQKLELKNDSIVVFVGPNNAGKSQCLRDIFELLGDAESKTIVVKKLGVHPPTSSLDALDGKTCGVNIAEYLAAHFKKNGRFYQGLDVNVHESCVSDITGLSYGKLRNVFAAFARTDFRLSLCNPVPNIDDNEIAQHPLHQLLREQDVEEELSRRFHEAFGYHVQPLRNSVKKTPLKCFTADIPMGSNPTQSSRDKFNDYNKKLSEQSSLHEQGDGMRSFAGLLLGLVLKRIRTHLLDEPESFLHPPQAYLAGKMIADMLGDDRQAFISTHSLDLVKGLLDAAPSRIQLVRITRTEDVNRVTFPSQSSILGLWKNSLLRFSNIMDGLFHARMVLCESDSDCKLYQAVAVASSEFSVPGKEMYFTHCGGKFRCHKILPTLRSLGLDVITVVDFDIFNDKKVLDVLAESAGVAKGALDNDYQAFENGLPKAKTDVDIATFKNEVNRILHEQTGGLTNTMIRKIRDVMRPLTVWDELKAKGLSVIADAQAKGAAERMMAELSKHGVYVVPVGQLESFISEMNSTHGPAWALGILEKHPDVENDKVYERVVGFMKTWKFGVVNNLRKPTTRGGVGA